MANDSLREILDILPKEVQIRTKLSIGIAKRIEYLMIEKGLSKKKLAESMNRRPSEVTKWLSGEHNFTIATLSMLSAFFDSNIIDIVREEKTDKID